MNLIDRWFQFLLDRKVCRSCEALQHELAIAHDLNRKLVDSLVYNPDEKQEEPQRSFEPIKSKYTPWPVKRQQLEMEERTKALEEKLNASKV